MPYILKVISEDRTLLESASALFSWMHASSQLNGKRWRWLLEQVKCVLSVHAALWCRVFAMNGCNLEGLPASVVSLCSVWCCLWTGIRQRYSKPGANTKHLNLKSVISIPKSLNIEIRSSVQQRLIFTLIYHSHIPCTQGLITPYMVNKPLAGSRQCVMFTQRQCIYYTVRIVSQCLWRTVIQCKNIQFRIWKNTEHTCSIWECFDVVGGLGRKGEAFVCTVHAFFSNISLPVWYSFVGSCAA